VVCVHSKGDRQLGMNSDVVLASCKTIFLYLLGQTKEKAVKLISSRFLNTSSERGTQKFPDWPPGVRTANGTALYH
jgi:hypothetical protein